MSSAKMSKPRDKSGAAQNAAKSSALNFGADWMSVMLFPPSVRRFDQARRSKRVPVPCGDTITSEVIATGAQAWLRLLGEPRGGWCPVARLAGASTGESARPVAERGRVGAALELHRDRALPSQPRDGARPRRGPRHSVAGTQHTAARCRV